MTRTSPPAAASRTRRPHHAGGGGSEADLVPRTATRPRTERPRLHKVILVNDDFTPREFVVSVLKAVFRTTDDQAWRIMITAHRRGVCVVAVYTREVAETKAVQGSEAGRKAGFPLRFSTEPES